MSVVGPIEIAVDTHATQRSMIDGQVCVFSAQGEFSAT